MQKLVEQTSLPQSGRKESALRFATDNFMAGLMDTDPSLPTTELIFMWESITNKNTPPVYGHKPLMFHNHWCSPPTGGCSVDGFQQRWQLNTNKNMGHWSNSRTINNNKTFQNTSYFDESEKGKLVSSKIWDTGQTLVWSSTTTKYQKTSCFDELEYGKLFSSSL